MTYFDELQTALAGLDHEQLDALAALILGCQGTVWIAGNGGSAATAQHWACDLSKAAGRRVQALGCNTAVLTAWANDERYELALANELERLSRPGDVLIAISCSGTSPNIITAIRQAWLLKLKRGIVTGSKWLGVTPVDAVVTVKSEAYGIIEDCHMAIGHWLTDEVKT